MNTLSKITSQNKGKDGYSDAQLNNAVAGAKRNGLSKVKIFLIAKLEILLTIKLTLTTLVTLLLTIKKNKLSMF